jgi:hypothetical protein
MHRTTRTQTSMLRMGFERMTTVLERAKTIHTPDRAVNVIGLGTNRLIYSRNYCIMHCHEAVEFHYSTTEGLANRPYTVTFPVHVLSGHRGHSQASLRWTDVGKSGTLRKRQETIQKERELCNRISSSGLLYPRGDTRHGV